MPTTNELVTEQDWKELQQKATSEPVLLFKHSTQCPISADAYKQYQAFLETEQGQQITTAFVKVIESRPISNQIAEDLGVVHKSPQAFLLKDGQVQWTESHWNITQENIEKALEA
ncbi:bacillithiol system redox-active protein YtxJ [Alkalicoccobacillus porphyridii]|uniref:Bacillithiol system redox-active protein YtxJ n=1 Tax=Alkalicoccobacillus porphyridii TaxID=2597270 RepID=A0A553ZUD8_9BACI|nr:bacillithiol system redox-active protein YtxJ [Alkalicoccobacillus porphyridii]TSB45101.1 bacillithiol system redox-active protein YtxJ [Alkalicoccobacillus porphyridii]